MPAESAAQHVVARIPVARPGDLVAAAIAALAGRSFDVLDTLYVVMPHREQLVGLGRTPLQDLTV